MVVESRKTPTLQTFGGMCLTLLFAMTIHLFYLLYSYQELMVAKYGCKREKSREAKWRSAEEHKPVQEMERAVGVDLFLEAQEQWAKDSPHQLIILHEMFLHAAYEGWNDAEQTVHWGCQQNMPQLDPEVGIPTVQLVHPEIDREQLLELYLEVYRLHRLPGSPPGEPTILEEISSVLPRHPPEEKGTPNIQKPVCPEGFHLSQNRLSLCEWEDSIDRSLARVHEAHRKALLTTVTLEEEMERLYRKKAHSRPGWKQRDSCGPDDRSRKR